jgi:glyoxylate reductase
MSKPRVFVTRRLPGPAIGELGKICDVDLHGGDGPPTREEILKGVREADGIICLLSDRIDSEVIETGTKLKIISNYAVGYENIDLDAARSRGILVTNTPDVLTDATADLTLALILAVMRRIIPADRYFREGRFRGWAPELFLGSDLKDKVLGIIGLGRIGSAVARRCAAFGMSIVFHDPSPGAARERIEGFHARQISFDELLWISDVITIHCPAAPETRHLISEKEFSVMKQGVYFINTARGSIVDEEALVRALQSGKVRGAGLDVYEREPLAESELLHMENVVLLPHIGSGTEETRARMAMMAVENCIAGVTGGRPKKVVL